MTDNESRYREALERIRSRTGCEDSLFYAIANEALNPEPEFEEVTVERWMCPICLECTFDNDGQHSKVKFTGTYRRPVKKKVKRREEISIKSFDDWRPMSVIEKPTGRVYFFAEWEE